MALRAKGGAAVATLTRVASVIGVRGALKWARCLRQKAMISSAGNRRRDRDFGGARFRFARDSPLEEGVCCELVSEIGLSGECRNKA
jgi:hypothetical protein